MRNSTIHPEECCVSRKVDIVLAILFVVLFIGWLGSDGGATFGLLDRSTGWYANEVDPIFRHPPSWLVTSGWFGFAFGPLYALSAYGLFRRSTWVTYVVLPLAGMAVVANGIYLVEDLGGDVPPLNLAWFYTFNVGPDTCGNLGRCAAGANQRINSEKRARSKDAAFYCFDVDVDPNRNSTTSPSVIT
jgi:hypothetical protein